MPDHRTARPSDGGYRDRTGDLLLAKAQDPVHTGARQGTNPASVKAAAAAAATRGRTAPESLRETDPYAGIRDANAQARLDRQYAIAAESADRYRRGGISAGSDAADGLVRWDVLEHHARTLDRSEATHALRVRHHQATRAQAHVRTAVGW